MPRFPILRKEFKAWLIDKHETGKPISFKTHLYCPSCPIACAVHELKNITLHAGHSSWTVNGNMYDSEPYPPWAEYFVDTIDAERKVCHCTWRDISAQRALSILESQPRSTGK